MIQIAPRNNPTRHRGQAGMTMIELIITFVLGAIVIGPVVGVAYFVMKRREPVIKSAEASKQLRVFRNVLADDWASASEIVIDPAPFPLTYATCNGAGFFDGPIRIAMVTSHTISPWDLTNRAMSDPNPMAGTRLRIIYREAPNPDGTVRIVRQVCRHRATSASNPTWQLGARTDEIGYNDAAHTRVIPIGQNKVLLNQVRSLVLPPSGGPPDGHSCNTSTVAPFPPCDMNVTVVGIDENNINSTFNPSSPHASTAQRTTIRLHQQVGPLS